MKLDHEIAMQRVALRRIMWQRAMQGDTRMLIWLGRQVLGQWDTQEIDHGRTIITLVSGGRHFLDSERR